MFRRVLRSDHLFGGLAAVLWVVAAVLAAVQGDLRWAIGGGITAAIWTLGIVLRLRKRTGTSVSNPAANPQYKRRGTPSH